MRTLERFFVASQEFLPVLGNPEIPYLLNAEPRRSTHESGNFSPQTKEETDLSWRITAEILLVIPSAPETSALWER
jgi:hypothetical protein